MKVLIWVQHLLGMGHIMRAAAIARALAADGARPLLASGAPIPDVTDLTGVETASLPPCRAADASFKVLLDAEDRPVTPGWHAARAAQLAEIAARFDPDAILTETFPLGRRAFRGELLPLLDSRRPGVLALASVRDVLVAAPDEKERWMADAANRYFDRILVHSDPAVIRLDDSFGPAATIADRVVYTGFVASAAPVAAQGTDGAGEVVVSCGSGALGARLLIAAADARALSAAASGLTWRLLAGFGVGEEDFQAIRQGAPAGVIVERARPDFAGLLKRARASVSQGGYNTVMDVLSANVPAVIVPISASGETEQRQRAEILARRGLVTCLPEDDLTPQRLAAAVDAAITTPRPPVDFDMTGAETTARIMRTLHAEGPGR
ncbi:MAG: glycosyltransferase [Rhodobiaceae bacterium]|nr:glycosyltransferase [Rhodobiaceae bacterium]